MGDDQPNNGPWLVRTLDKIDRAVERIDVEVRKNGKDIASLKVKSSLWGGLAGAIGGAAGFVASLLRG